MKINSFVGEVRDPASVKNAMYGVDYTFHAVVGKVYASVSVVPSLLITVAFFTFIAVFDAMMPAKVVLLSAVSVTAAVYCLLATKGASAGVQVTGLHHRDVGAGRQIKERTTMQPKQ